MSIRTKLTLFSTIFVSALIVSIALVAARSQRLLVEAQARERLEALMDGVERLGREAVAAQDALMLHSYVLFLQREKPELACAEITYRGHTARLGSEEGRLLYLTRTVTRARPVRYTVTDVSTAAAVGRLSATTGGVTISASPRAVVRVAEESAPDALEIRVGFREDAVRAAVDAALRPLLRRTAELAAAFLLLGGIGVAALAKVMTAPLLALTGAVASVSEGRFVSVPVSGRDEVAALAQRFNGMSARLRQLTEFREDLLHTLTHELNTPLAGMKGYLELWKDDGKARITDASIDAMAQAVQRMEDSLTSALSLYSGQAAGDGVVHRVSIRRVFEELETLFSAALAAKKLRLMRPALGPQGWVVGDAELVRRILQNLLSNAIKYTPAGGAIQFELRDEPQHVLFWVADSGHGIRPEDLPHIFTKFYRTSDAGKRRIPGTGLGLAIVRQAVAALGGTIRAESQVGRGSAFIVRLPRERRPA